MKFFIACYLLAKLRLDLVCRFYLVAYKFNMPSHFSRVCAVQNKLVNYIKMFIKLHRNPCFIPPSLRFVAASRG